jgi:hypothetical protein
MKNFLMFLTAALCVILMASCEVPVSPDSVPASPPVVSGVTITSGDIFLPKNSTYQFSAEVSGENKPPQDVTWSLTALDGSDNPITPKQGTGIGVESGRLSIVEDENAAKLIVRASSVFTALAAGENIYGEITVTLVEPGTKIVNVESQSGSLIYGKAGTATYRVTAVNIADEEYITVQWVRPIPAGVTDNTEDLAIVSGSAILRFNTTNETPEGDYRFTVTIDGITSSQQRLVVGKRQLSPPAKPILSAEGVASWVSVSNAVSYTVRLYKDRTLYGEPVTGISGMTYDVLSAMREAGPGSYTVRVAAISDKASYADSPESEASDAQEVKQRTRVQYVWWFETSKARWVNVDGDSNYTVQLYKGESAVGSPVSVNRSNDVNPSNPAETVTTHDFGSAITEAGDGLYYFGVITKGDERLILDAAETKETNGYAYGTVQRLSKPTGVALSDQGVATWTAVSNASSYTGNLYKGGTVHGAPVTSISGTTHNFLSAMHGGGPGSYTVKVTAIGNGTTWANSEESEASGAQEVKQRTGVAFVWWEGTEARWVDPDSSGDYKVQLYKYNFTEDKFVAEGTSIDVTRQGITNDGNTRSVYNFTSLTAGGVYAFTVTTKGTGLLLDGEPSALLGDDGLAKSGVYSSSTRSKVDYYWTKLASADFDNDETIATEWSIPSGKTLVIKAGKTLTVSGSALLTAGNLKLGAGKWKATNADVSITADQITMDSASAWGAKFGKDDGTAATVLAAPFENGKDVSDTGWSATGADVTLSQDGNNLTVKGASAAANFNVWKTGGIWVKAGLTIEMVTVNMDEHKPDDNGWTSAIYMKPGSTITFPNTNSKIKVYASGGTQEFGSSWWGKTSLITLGSNIKMKRFSESDHRVTDIFVGADGTGNENKLTNVHGTDDFWIARGFNHDS